LLLNIHVIQVCGIQSLPWHFCEFCGNLRAGILF
jgi:hypothetical protein